MGERNVFDAHHDRPVRVAVVAVAVGD